MTFLRPLALAALCASALSFFHTAAAQETRAPAAPKNLDVSVFDGEGQPLAFVASRSGGPAGVYDADISPPRRLAGWKQPEGEPPVTLIRFSVSPEGEALRIKVLAVSDDSRPPEAPGPKYGEREREVGSYVAREGETVSVKEIKRFGFEPVVLGVAEPKSGPEMPPIPAPARAVSRVKSVEVVSYLTEGAQMERARLVVRNVSPKNVVGLEIAGDQFSDTAFTAGTRPLIASGATYEAEVNSGRGGQELPDGGFEPAPQPDALFVSTAVFEDDSYEGDAKTAATMIARRKGRFAQFARVLEILRATLAAERLDSSDALARLKSQVGGLRVDVEPSVLDELASRFPKLPRDECRKLLAESAVDGLRAARGESLNMLEKVESARAQKAEGFDLRRQLEGVRALVEKKAGVKRD